MSPRADAANRIATNGGFARTNGSPHLLESGCARKNAHISARRVDAAAGRSDEPLRKRLAAGPGVAASLDGVEHDGRVVSTVRVFAAGDVRRHRRFDRLRCAAVSAAPTSRPTSGRRKATIRRDPRRAAVVRSAADRRCRETRSSAPARWSVHQLHGSVCAAPTIPTAAIRSDSVQESTKAMPPPLESRWRRSCAGSML